LKTQKLEEVPDMPAAAAAEILGRAADAQSGDTRVTDRIANVQDLLADDLRWIESALSSAVDEGETPATLAARHLVTRGGKRVRPMALMLSAACFGRVTPEVRQMAVVSEMVHSATLLHDDVVDEGMERRGVPTSRLAWGNAISVLGGDLLLVHALQRTQQHAPEIMPDLNHDVTPPGRRRDRAAARRSELDVSEATYERILRDRRRRYLRGPRAPERV